MRDKVKLKSTASAYYYTTDKNKKTKGPSFGDKVTGKLYDVVNNIKKFKSMEIKDPAVIKRLIMEEKRRMSMKTGGSSSGMGVGDTTAVHDYFHFIRTFEIPETEEVKNTIKQLRQNFDPALHSEFVDMLVKKAEEITGLTPAVGEGETSKTVNIEQKDIAA